MKTVKNVLIVCIVFGFCRVSGTAQLSFKNSSILMKEKRSLNIDSTSIPHLQGKPSGYYLLKYWKPDLVVSSETSQMNSFPENQYSSLLDKKLVTLEIADKIKPVKQEFADRKLTHYPSENNPGITGTNPPDTSGEILNSKTPDKITGVNYASDGKFEYYVPDTSRISDQQSDFPSKKDRSVTKQKVPFYETTGGHIVNGVLYFTGLFGRIGLAAILSGTDHSSKPNVSKEGSKSKAPNVSRQRSSNYSNTNPGR